MLPGAWRHGSRGKASSPSAPMQIKCFPATVQESLDAAGGLASWKSRDSVKSLGPNADKGFSCHVQESLDAAGGLASWKSRDSVKSVQQWLRKFNPWMARVLMDERDEVRQTCPRPFTRPSLYVRNFFGCLLHCCRHL